MTIRFLQPEMTAWLSVVPVMAGLWLIHFLYKYRARRRSS